MTLISLPWSLRALVFAGLVAADSFPYNPTKVLWANNSSYAYILQPSPQSSNQGQISSIDLRNGFAANKIPTSAISDLPFLSNDALVPYTAILDPSGNITAIAGSCTAGADKTAVWTFLPNTSGSGSWYQYQTSDQNLSPGSNLTGINYLANGVAFSPDAGSSDVDLGFYLFGGMCPFSATDATTWVSDSAYSNTMLQLLPQQSSFEQTVYDIQVVASRGPAIAEAGFTLTGLPPSYSLNSSGQVQSQQQDFLLIGGHTQNAFLNMSNVAIFSLPQESWTFIPVQQPSGFKTDLTIRQETFSVEPRSGHTAVLSEDGTTVVVYGGWVGDVSNPATPQLVVLQLGSEYGGGTSQDWAWSAPSLEGVSPAGNGLYGHGATMLPGDIMMIAGGYSISSTSSSNKTKRDTQAVNDSVYLYNVSSNSWIELYTPPDVFSTQADSNSGGPLSKTSQQAGLGVGLGLGALVLAGLCCFYFWYSRRLKKQRVARQQELLPDSSQVSFMPLDQSYMDRPGIDGRGGDFFAGHEPHEMIQAESSGLWTNIPTPNRGLRSGLAKRPYMYHAAPRFDERRLNPGNGFIHPIMESEDEHSLRGDDDNVEESDAVKKLRDVEQAFTDNKNNPEQSLRELQTVLKSRSSSPVKDPFADPEPNPLGSHPVWPIVQQVVKRKPVGGSRWESPTRRPLSTEMDGSMNWMIIEGDDDAVLGQMSNSNGRSSPSRTDDRTSSTLSDASQRSHASSNSITRTMSTRTGALLTAALALRRHADLQESSSDSASQDRTSTMGTLSSGRLTPYNFENPYGTSHNLPIQRAPHVKQNSADSFSSARTSFPNLQDQGQALLGGRPLADRDDPYQRAVAATSSSDGHQTSPQEVAAPQSVSPKRAKGWMGSLRRAITAMSNDRTFSFTGTAMEQYDTEPRTSSSSPTRSHKSPNKGSTPRRAASDGGALSRQKRGQTDWEKDKDFIPYRDDPDPGDWGERRTSVEDRAAENEWDVEGAASKRDVQFMFTVPKARLRVVNADIERASMRSVSDSAMSRSESIRNLRRAESVNTVRSRSDGERGLERTILDSTAEEVAAAQTTGRDI